MDSPRNFNPDQLTAIRQLSGPMLVLAGAGTGKTTVITERVKYLVESGLAKTSEILCLTFTEKAAKEMEERIDVSLPLGYTQMWVTTFHSFCDRVLRNDGLHIGLDTNYKLMSTVESVSFFKKHFFDFEIDYFRPLGNPYKFIDGLLSHFSRLQDEDISPQKYFDWAKSLPPGTPEQVLDRQQYLELAALYQEYAKLKTAYSLMDYSDLITRTLDLFRLRPNLLSQYQKKFKFILVDEFQDTNFSQSQVVNLLAAQCHSLTVVCDDDQAIYAWRGAAVNNVLKFRQQYPDSKLVVLTQNYRSSQSILDRSYQLIQHNNPDRLEYQEGINKRLQSSLKSKSPAVFHLHYPHIEAEAEGVAQEIAKLLADQPFAGSVISPKDIAVLVRANSHAQPLAQALSRAGLPHQFLGPEKLLDQSEVKDLVAYLNLLHNLENDTACFRVMSHSVFGISPRQLADLSSHAQRLNQHLFAAAEILADPAYLPFIGLVTSHLALLPSSTAGEILYRFIQDSGLVKNLIDYSTPEQEQQAKNLMKFFAKLKSLETTGTSSVSDVLAWLELVAQMGESPQAAEIDWSLTDAVNILTIHSSKGLEFPVVFVVNLVSGRFPSLNRRDQIPIPESFLVGRGSESEAHLQEERRLAYVAMTRAKYRLYLTSADFYSDAKRPKKLSPFISEALAESGHPYSHLTIQTSSAVVKPRAPASPVSIQPSKLNITYLSYSQIETFIDCPFHYKAKYILGIPTPPSAASSFGNSIHATLKQYFELINQGEPADILDLLKSNWSSSGFENQKHEAKYFSLGSRYLTEYLSGQDAHKQPPLLLEQPFTVPVNPHLKIGGKIDRIDLLPDGRLEIIDYKTSQNPLTEKQAADNLQLSFYALAATRLPDSPFARHPQDLLLSLYYFHGQHKVTTTRTADQLQAAVQQIEDYAGQIAASDFKCNGSHICRQCDFRLLCSLVVDNDPHS